ncbi:c-type cytochrome [Halomonas sp. WWR20]
MKKLLTLAALTLAMTGVAHAAGDPAAGESKIGVCVACHGKDGKGIAPMYPNLAGQNALYLQNALTAYREGQRQGGNAALMAPQAMSLSDQDIADIAAYFSQLEP